MAFSTELIFTRLQTNTWFLTLNIAKPIVWKRSNDKIVQQDYERETCYTILP